MRSSFLLGLLLLQSITNSSALSGINRRQSFHQSAKCIATTITTGTALSNPSVARAANTKSRTEGYAVQYTEREWAVSRINKKICIR